EEHDMGEEEIAIAFREALNVQPGSADSTQQKTDSSTSTAVEPTFLQINTDLDLPFTSTIFRLEELQDEKSKILAAKMNLALFKKTSKPQAPKKTRLQNDDYDDFSDSDGHESSDDMNLLSAEESEVDKANGVDNLAPNDFVLVAYAAQLSKGCPLTCNDLETTSALLTPLGTQRIVATRLPEGTHIRCGSNTLPVSLPQNIGALKITLPCNCSIYSKNHQPIFANTLCVQDTTPINIKQILPAVWTKYPELQIPVWGEPTPRFDNLKAILNTEWSEENLQQTKSNILSYLIPLIIILNILITLLIIYLCQRFNPVAPTTMTIPCPNHDNPLYNPTTPTRTASTSLPSPPPILPRPRREYPLPVPSQEVTYTEVIDEPRTIFAPLEPESYYVSPNPVTHPVPLCLEMDTYEAVPRPVEDSNGYTPMHAPQHSPH
ncbi:hypothetical protein ILUMI_24520, partial [Ignelater luminosus]